MRHDDKGAAQYAAFLKTEDRAVPRELSQKVRSLVHQRLRWDGPRAMGKFISVHLLSALVTLSFCPQFGIGPVGGGHGISHYFMGIGPWACALFCSLVFFGIGTLASRIWLTASDLRRLDQLPLLLVSAYGGAILAAFLWIGDRSGEGRSMFFEAEYIAIWFLTGLMIMMVGLRLFQAAAQQKT